jgi:hypothetical protein
MGNSWSMENTPDESNVSNNISEEKRKKTRRAKTLRRRSLAVDDIRDTPPPHADKRHNDTMMSTDLVVRNEPFPTMPIPMPLDMVSSSPSHITKKRKTRSNRHS